MADIITQYRTKTSPEDREKAKGAGANNQNNDYRANSHGFYGVSASDVSASLPSLMDSSLYRAGSDAINVAEGFYQTGLKLSLSEIGFWKQVFQYGMKANTSGLTTKIEGSAAENNLNGRDNNYQASTPVVYNRQDQNNEYVFRCGDYFLPLSFSYSIRASKSTAISQLVDGVEIIQHINKKPKMVDLQIRIERNQNRIQNTNTGSNMSFVSSDLYSPNSDIRPTIYGVEAGSDPALMALVELGTALNSLYENQDVFEIEHKTLNNDFGLNWVFMEDFEFNTNPGSTIVDIKMTLHQVNMAENAIIFGEATINPDTSAGGGSIAFNTI